HHRPPVLRGARLHRPGPASRIVPRGGVRQLPHGAGPRRALARADVRGKTMAGKPMLETERLLLREFDEDDAAAISPLGSDPAIIRYTGDPGGGLKSVEHALEILRLHPLADYQKHGYGRWACVHKASGQVI